MIESEIFIRKKFLFLIFSMGLPVVNSLSADFTVVELTLPHDQMVRTKLSRTIGSFRVSISVSVILTC